MTYEKRSENMDHKLLAPVVWMLTNASIWIDFNPLHNTVGFPDTYPLDSDYLVDITIHHLNNQHLMTDAEEEGPFVYIKLRPTILSCWDTSIKPQ